LEVNVIGEREVGGLVLEALEKAIQQEGESRLVSKGTKTPGLLPGGKQTAAKQEAKDQCLDPRLGLFEVREVEEGKGKSAAKVHFVTITPAGIELLFGRISASRRAELLEKCANPHKEAALEASLRAVEGELRQVAVEQERLDKRASELRDFVKRMVDEQLTAIDQRRESLERQAAEIKRLAPCGPRAPGPSLVPPPEPTTEEDIDFQRSLCRELVFAWQDASDAQVREDLERVMMNTGLEPMGEVGAIVPFDGREHRTESDLRPGDPAEVVGRGWQLLTPQGPLLIAPAQVAVPQKSQEIGNAPHA
jgi:hypothetical protein